MTPFLCNTVRSPSLGEEISAPSSLKANTLSQPLWQRARRSQSDKPIPIFPRPTSWSLENLWWQNGNDSTLFADTREVATEHPRCPRSHHLQPHQEASQDGWEEISTGEGGRCQWKVVVLHVDGLAKVVVQGQQPVTSP